MIIVFVAAWTASGIGRPLFAVDLEHISSAVSDHVTTVHGSMEDQFSDLGDKLVELEVIGKCRWLKSEIRALEDAIYVRERGGALDGNGNPHGEYIRALKKDLKDLQDEYEAFACILKLA